MAAIFKSRHGLSADDVQRISGYWNRIRNTGIMVEFDSFDELCQWAAENGYAPDKRLIRINRKGPFSADNCAWESDVLSADSDQARAAEWDAFVGPIRERYKDDLERLEAEKKDRSVVRVWQYEHPDRIREMRGGKA